jgi:N-acetylneuraminate synthase
LEFLDSFDLKYNKIASAMIVDETFLLNAAKKKKYTFISTGMSTIQNIDKAVKIFREKNCPFELMHSVSTYPMLVEDANLITINALKKKYDCKVGYSGHEDGVAVSLAAASLGISSLERHITLSRSMYGSDQSASLEPRGMRELVATINIMIKAYGEERLGHITKEEEKIAKKLRAHLKISN